MTTINKMIEVHFFTRAKTSQNLKTKRAKHRNDKVDVRQMNNHIGCPIKGGLNLSDKRPF